MREQNKNSGFSLIELVVVMAIMGVVALFSVEIYGNVNSADVEAAAGNTDSILSLLRARTITKANEFKLVLSENADGEFEVCLYENQKTTDASGNVIDVWKKTADGYNLGNKVTVKCVGENGNEFKLEDGNSFRAICSKSNGSYKSAVALDSSGNLISGTEKINKIVFKKGKHTETIRLVLPTGRHYIE